MKCSKSRRFLGRSPRPRRGSLRRSPRPPSRKGLLAFGNRRFPPSALAISPTPMCSLVYPTFWTVTPLIPCPQSRSAGDVTGHTQDLSPPKRKILVPSLPIGSIHCIQLNRAYNEIFLCLPC